MKEICSFETVRTDCVVTWCFIPGRVLNHAAIQTSKYIVHVHIFMSFRTAVCITKRIDDSMKPDPLDNVWCSRYYKWPVYSFADAVQSHRETHHPTVYNSPDADLYVNLELDMRAVKVVIFFISVPLI